ncbi:hypothetical protein NOLU111490_17515 [Novosphingobium lubricantis]
MSCVSAIAEPLTPEAIIVDAARCWRETVDRHRPILPTLFARLEMRGAGFLAPAIAALLAIHEVWSGRRFTAGDTTVPILTDDERTLLDLLEATEPPAFPLPAQPGLTGPLRIALRSTRILLRRVIGHDLGEVAGTAAQNAIFFAVPGDSALLSQDRQATLKTLDAA